MPAKKRYSLSEVRSSYTPDKARAELSGELPLYLLYRPLSFSVAFVLLRLSVPTWLVTASGGVIAALLVPLAVLGGAHVYAWIAGLGFVFHVLDCADGTMARTRGQSSSFGALLDGFCDYAFWSALLTALGVLAEREAALPFSSLGTEFGMTCALVVLLQRDVRRHFYLLHGEAAVFNEHAVARRPSAAQWSVYALAGLENLYVFAIGIGGALGVLGAVLASVCGYVAAVALVALVVTFRKAHARDAAARSSDCAQHEASVLPAERK